MQAKAAYLCYDWGLQINLTHNDDNTNNNGPLDALRVQ